VGTVEGMEVGEREGRNVFSTPRIKGDEVVGSEVEGIEVGFVEG
jgi:hypothetical protein